ncbi:hypothetical protein LOTGIDRAFT_168146 [Lottia gigantea]|uniref:Apple domain-containing protein n=1 Tax=Lottia gigantea TaxID=225164 RepID=V3Z3B9_LOTGI|nr:hypothetical protein LOTGIDRAFT_168146 [Lottia gigantea]ESO85118.1 hypothetical protein LOTGIDRAFT_168146 [Lottia gigantea]
MKIITILVNLPLILCLTSYRCPNAPPKSADAPKIPELPLSFYTNVEINVVDKDYTISAEQRLDYEGNRGLVILNKLGEQTSVIYRYDTIELFNIKDGVCQVLKLNDSSEVNLFGFDTSDGTFHINSAADALRFGSKYGQYFINRTILRGKPVNHWQTCFNWTEASSTFKADYYFSDPSWNSSSGLSIYPVRIEVTGQQTFTDKDPRQFHHIYDYYNFIAPDGQDPLLFEPPLGVYCPGRYNSRPLPTIPNHFSYRENIISLDSVSQYDRTLENGIVCDVWISETSELNPTGIGIPANCTIETFFIVKSFDYANELGTKWDVDANFQIPYRTIVSSPGVDYITTYDYTNYNPNEPPIEVFDTSDCYSDQHKLRIQVTFKGQYHSDTEDKILRYAQYTIAETMGLSPLRFQRVSLEYDNRFVYISGTIVDRPPSAAQFTLVPGQEMETMGDQYWSNITDAASCADLCITTPDFVCNSFDFCTADKKACHLSKRHVTDGSLVLKQSVCNHYSRTVNVSTVDTKSIDLAYSDLKVQLYAGGLEVAINKDDESVEDFMAVDTKVLFGYSEQIPFPSIANSFSYRAEVVIPSHKYVTEVDVFYDYDYKLLRYDYRGGTPFPPYYSLFTLTTIHDFNTGLAYVIDQEYLNCTVSQITAKGPLGFDAELDPKAQKYYNGYVVDMKSPLEFFGLTSSYTFIGQKTVRGILCDVFEGEVNNFIPPGLNDTVKAIFQYYFQSGSWTTITDGSTDVPRSMPILLNVVTEENGYTMSYNIYDYKDEHVPMGTFNIQPCYDGGQQHRFMIAFNQPFHPYLEVRQTLFKHESLFNLAQVTGVSPIRFQDIQLEYSFSSVFFTATVLDQLDFIYQFKQITGGIPVEYSEVKINDIQYAPDCASQCINTLQIICNGFDFCSKNTQCLLHSDHVSTVTTVTQKANQCTHWSRLINGTAPGISMRHAYDVIKDMVYKGLFKVTVPQLAGDPFVYTASNIRDDINQPYSPIATEGSYLKQFKVVSGHKVLKKYVAKVPQTAVDDCATICATMDKFTCQSFEYCYTTGDCSLSTIHPDQHPELLQRNDFCDLYGKQYVKEYQQFKGQVLSTQADKILDKVTTTEDCAAYCSKESTFSCLSFDYCAKDRSCRLRKSHILDSGSTITSSTTCDHYSRNYVFDFQDKGGRLDADPNDVIINSATSQSCAKLCVDQSGVQCNSFEYCGNITQCRLSSSVSIGFKVEKDFCDVYTRPKSSTINTSNRAKPNLTSKDKNNTSTGAIIGIAFGMLLPGILIGALGLYIFQKRERNSSPMNIQFIKHEDE